MTNGERKKRIADHAEARGSIRGPLAVLNEGLPDLDALQIVYVEYGQSGASCLGAPNPLISAPHFECRSPISSRIRLSNVPRR
jgi:hypothetical protein